MAFKLQLGSPRTSLEGNLNAIQVVCFAQGGGGGAGSQLVGFGVRGSKGNKFKGSNFVNRSLWLFLLGPG